MKITDRKYYTAVALNQITEERERQERKWGEQNHHALKWLAILGEEFGEACKAAIEDKTKDYREELVQLAAVAVAAMECFDRHSTEEK